MPVLVPPPETDLALAANVCAVVTLGNVVCVDVPMEVGTGIQTYEEVNRNWATYAEVHTMYADYLSMKYDERS